MNARTAEQPSALLADRVTRTLADFRLKLSGLKPLQWGHVARAAIEWAREIDAEQPRRAFARTHRHAEVAAGCVDAEALRVLDRHHDALIESTPPAINQLLTVDAAIALISLDPRDRHLFRPFEDQLDFEHIVRGRELRAALPSHQRCCHSDCPYRATHIERSERIGRPRICDFHIESIWTDPNERAAFYEPLATAS